MFDDYENREFYRKITEEIEVLRKPYIGIVSGYHELAYSVLGPEVEGGAGSVQISSNLHVSPKLVWTPAQAQKTFGEIFDEKELMETELMGRVFAFPNVMTNSFNVESRHLKITHHDRSPDSLAEKILREFQEREIIDTGVIRTPNIRYYPLAVQRFIHEILAEEFT